MGLNKSTGNMYPFVTHTWNTVKGKCAHDCTYCYMKRWGQLKPIRFDESELKTDLGQNNFIFVGSSCDMWSDDIPEAWIIKTLDYCSKFLFNKYLFQTKNPANIRRILPHKSIVCVTLETDQWLPEIMKYSPTPQQRFHEAKLIRNELFVTIEPIMDFDLPRFLHMIKDLGPTQVNIGEDSGKNNLPEPPKEKILKLINELSTFTNVFPKINLNRLLCQK